jgi:hypothetical protein
LLDGAGGGGCCTRQEASTFPFFGAGLSAPAAGDRRFGAETFLLADNAVGRALLATCAAAMLVCSVGRGGMQRARVAAEVFLASAPPLGFGAFGGAPMVAVGGIE